MFKNLLVGTRIGPLAMDLRDRRALRHAVKYRLEIVGDAANDMLARLLTERLCVAGRTFIDVGAHIGSMISGASRHSAPGRILAIEAIPGKAQQLRRYFRQVEVHAVALGDRDGEADFFVDELRPGFSSLNSAIATQSRAHEIVVPIRQLDNIVALHDVDVVKIDVEGAELGVLRGAEKLTAASRPTFMFESGAEEMAGFTRNRLWQHFHDRDYEILVPNRVAHRLRP